MSDLRQRRLYLCVGLRDDLATLIPAVVAGGVDVVQLRDKDRPASDVLGAAATLAARCRDLGVPFIVNDSPEIALDAGADGVHVGQDDASVERCRELLGGDAIVGLSTHEPREFDAGLLADTSYLSAGPIEATPTKPGRPGTGVDYAAACQRRSDRPVFVTGGVRADNVGALVGAGLRHFVVVRAVLDARDPAAAAREIRDAIEAALA
ncbi:MAG: thiamine phosphate synthase [Acidimicrobiales bacterium]